MMTPAAVSVVKGQATRFAVWLDVVIHQGEEIFAPDVFYVPGNLLYPTLQPRIIHLDE
jgi:hypothetical protein